MSKKWLNTVENIISAVAALSTNLCWYSIEIPDLSNFTGGQKMVCWQGQLSDDASKMGGMQKCQTLWRALARSSQTVSAKLLDFSTQSLNWLLNMSSSWEPAWPSCFWPPSINWGLPPKSFKWDQSLNQCSVSFKPCHMNTYIGQFYKSGFGSLLVVTFSRVAFSSPLVSFYSLWSDDRNFKLYSVIFILHTTRKSPIKS